MILNVAMRELHIAMLSEIKNTLKGYLFVRTAAPSRWLLSLKYPPGNVKPAVNVTVEINTDRIVRYLQNDKMFFVSFGLANLCVIVSYA